MTSCPGVGQKRFNPALNTSETLLPTRDRIIDHKSGEATFYDAALMVLNPREGPMVRPGS
jgi:hypothetical protein